MMLTLAYFIAYLTLLAARGVEQQRHQRGGARTCAVVGQQCILELVLADDVLGEFHVQLVLGSEDLNVLRDAWREILDGPRSQYRVLIGRRLIGVVASGENEAGLCLVHASAYQVAVLQARALNG
jgi:hypothetical protein